MARTKFSEVLEKVELAAENRKRSLALSTARIVEFAGLVQADLGAPTEAIRLSEGASTTAFPMGDFQSSSEVPRVFTVYLAITTEEGIKRRSVRVEMDPEGGRQVLLNDEPWEADSLIDLRLAEAVADKLVAAFNDDDPLKDTP